MGRRRRRRRWRNAYRFMGRKATGKETIGKTKL
jgi:hypothetical protein